MKISPSLSIALALALWALAPGAGPAQAASQTMRSETVSFEVCLKTIRRVAVQLGVAPINVIETNQLRIVRFPVVDGSVLVSCSRPDRKMVITKSDKR